MLAVKCCLRHWSRIPASRCTFFSSETRTLKTLRRGLRIPDHRFSVISTAPRRPSARFVSLSGSFRTNVDPSPDREKFGSLSEDISSRRSFRKSSPDLQDLRFRDDSMERQEGAEEFRNPVRRNTPYWYFLVCKRLIKENKVGLH